MIVCMVLQETLEVVMSTWDMGETLMDLVEVYQT